MRRKRFKRHWARLKELQRQRPAYSTLLMKLGAAAHDAGRTSALVKVTLPEAPPKGERGKRVDFTFTLDRAALKKVRRREGRYLLRSNLTDTDPAKLWEFYLQLSEVENAFKELKGDLAIRPIHHQNEERIEAHIFDEFSSLTQLIAYPEPAVRRQRLWIKCGRPQSPSPRATLREIGGATWVYPRTRDHRQIDVRYRSFPTGSTC